MPTWTVTPWNNDNRMGMVYSLTTDADFSNMQFPAGFTSGYLFQIEIKTSADDAVTYTIASGLGTTLYTTTTSAAKSGEIGAPDTYWFMQADEGVKSTLANMASGTATIRVIVINN